jgi:hypothetical protein
MKATVAKLLDFLRKAPQFVIPIYQRTYSWTSKECRQLWDDIVRTGENDAITVHFIGSIVYIETGLSQVIHQAPLLVIDGQQRLTTVTLLIAALAQVLDKTEPVEGFSPRKLRNYYLLNPEETGEGTVAKTSPATGCRGCSRVERRYPLCLPEFLQQCRPKPSIDLPESASNPSSFCPTHSAAR